MFRSAIGQVHFNIVSYFIPTYCTYGNKYTFYHFIVYSPTRFGLI